MDMVLKFHRTTRRKVPRITASTLACILSITTPLISKAQEVPAGEPMAAVKTKSFDEPQFLQDMRSAAEIIVRSKEAKSVSMPDLDRMVAIWTTWKQERDAMSPEQMRLFNNLFFDSQRGLLGLPLTSTQRAQLVVAGILTGSATQVRDAGARSVRTVSVPVRLEDEVPRPSLTFFPEGLSIRRTINVGVPEVQLTPDWRTRIPAADHPSFSTSLAEGIRVEAIYSPGSKEAKEQGKKIADLFKRIPGDPNDFLGNDQVSGDEILQLYRDGRISEATEKSALIENLPDLVREIRFETPIFAIALGGESPRLRPFKNGSLYLSGIAALDILVNEEWGGMYDEKRRSISIEPTGNTNSDIVLRGGIRAAIELFGSKGTELSFDTTLIGNIGLPDYPPFGLGLKVSFTDVSGKVVPFGRFPVYSALSIESENYFRGNAPDMWRHKGALAASLFRLGDFAVMPVIDWSLVLSGGRALPVADKTLSVGAKLQGSAHTFGGRFIIGDELIGGGLVYTYNGGLTLGFDITKQSAATLGALPELNKLFVGGILQVDFSGKTF